MASRKTTIFEHHVSNAKRYLAEENLPETLRWALKLGDKIPPTFIEIGDSWSIEVTPLFADAERLDNVNKNNAYSTQVRQIEEGIKALAKTYKGRAALGLVAVVNTHSASASLAVVGYNARPYNWVSSAQSAHSRSKELSESEREFLSRTDEGLRTLVQKMLGEEVVLVVSPFMPRIWTENEHPIEEPLLRPESHIMYELLHKEAKERGVNVGFVGLAEGFGQAPYFKMANIPYTSANSREALIKAVNAEMGKLKKISH